VIDGVNKNDRQHDQTASNFLVADWFPGGEMAKEQ
jgi:hypothetical protein